MSTKLSKGSVGGVADQCVLAGQVVGDVYGEIGFTLEGGCNDGFDDGTGLGGLELFFKEVIGCWPWLAGRAGINGQVAKCPSDEGHDGIIGGGR